MAILANVLVSVVGGIASFLAQFVTKKIAFGLAAVTTLGVITVAVIAAMRTVVQGIAVALNEPLLLMGLSIGFPPNAPACVAAIATTWAACTLYGWQKSALDLFAKVS